MDVIDINQAANKVMKRLTNSGQVGRTEPAKVFTFDGDTTGKETYSNMVKVSDEILDLSQITKIAVYAVEADVSEEMSTADLKLLEGDGCAFLMTPDGGVTFVASYSVKKDDFTPGIYVIATENAYVSRIEFSETIHPIDPKYLPGVCLPVVELSTTFKAGSQYTDEEGKILTAAFEKNTPVVIKCNADAGDLGTFENTALVWCPATSGNFQLFVASFGGLILQILDLDSAGKWACNVQ